MLFKIHHCVNRVSRLYTVDVGNNDFIFLCNFGGRIIDVFEVEMRKMEGRGEVIGRYEKPSVGM